MRSGPVRRALRGGLGRRVQTAVIGLVLMVTTGAAVLALAVVAYSNAPFDAAFAAQRGADITATINPANCLAATSLSTERMGSWVDGTYTYGLYDHHYTPNSTSLDCISVLHDAQGNNLALSMGWKAARSWHPGGANVLFGDCSVHFIKNSIDNITWAAVGTRAGGEVYSSQF